MGSRSSLSAGPESPQCQGDPPTSGSPTSAGWPRGGQQGTVQLSHHPLLLRRSRDLPPAAPVLSLSPAPSPQKAALLLLITSLMCYYWLFCCCCTS